MRFDGARQVSDYDSVRDRQQAGIAALIALSIATARTPQCGHNPAQQDTLEQAEVAGKGVLSALGRKLSFDRMMRNSLYLILSSGLQAAFGFAFWMITARLFSASVVGIASSLISAATVISFIALFGLNSTFVRYLPTARNNRNTLITVGLILVAVCGAVVALIYAAATPVLAPRLSFILHRPSLTIGFALLSASSVVNLVTDSVFIAARKAGFNALIDGVIGGAAKILLVVMLSGAGAYGIFSASTGSMAAAGLASLVLMATVLRWRPTLRRCFDVIRPLLRFSFANYSANCLGLLPILIVPLIALDRLGAAAAAYYFIAFQLATMLYSAAFAVEQNFLAEGSQANANLRNLRKRGRRVLIMLSLPPCLVLIVAAHWVLLIFGPAYSQYGTISLMLLAAAALPVAAMNWFLAVLRLAGDLRAIVVSSAVYAGAICGLAWVLAPHGIAALSAAWPIGSFLSAAVAGRLSGDGRARKRQRVTPGRRSPDPMPVGRPVRSEREMPRTTGRIPDRWPPNSRPGASAPPHPRGFAAPAPHRGDVGIPDYWQQISRVRQ